MLKHGGGAIVNIGSIWAKQAIKTTPSSAYSMAKTGLHALTQHLAMELAEYHIRVNAVSPAVVNTPIYQGFIPKNEVDSVLQGFKSFHPIGRIGQAEDVARVVSFLLSEEAAWVTGAVWDVGCGRWRNGGTELISSEKRYYVLNRTTEYNVESPTILLTQMHEFLGAHMFLRSISTARGTDVI